MAASMVEIPDFGPLKEKVGQKLIKILDSVPGFKDLVLDPELIVPLEKVTGARLLLQHGVEKMYKLEPNAAMQCHKRIYIIKPDLEKVKMIADHINADKTLVTRKLQTVEVVMVPRKLYHCEALLEYEGVFGDINISSLDLGLLILEKDVLTLEIPRFIQDFYLNGNFTWLHTVASSLCSIQAHCGLIPNVYGHGTGSKLVVDLMKVLMKKYVCKPHPYKIGHLFLIDRDVDYAAPLLTQLTYQGQVDELFNINSGIVIFGKDITGKDQPTKIDLTSGDKVFDDIKNSHISKAFNTLVVGVKELVQEKQKRQEMSLGDVKKYVTTDLKVQQQQHVSVSMHVRVCELIIKGRGVKEQIQMEQSMIEGNAYHENVSYIEDLIIAKESRDRCLRLLCLLSHTQSGLPSKDYQSLRTLFLQSFGHEHLLTFVNLRKMGLFYDQELKLVPPTKGKLVGKMASALVQRIGQPTFQTVCRKLNLVPKTDIDVDLKYPTDPSYVYGGGYIPIACQLVNQVLEKEGFSGLEEVLRLLPGTTFFEVKAKSARGRGNSVSTAPPIDPMAGRVVLVFFIGGITYAEIAAFRLMGQLRGYTFILAATSIINGKHLVESVVEPVGMPTVSNNWEGNGVSS